MNNKKNTIRILLTLVILFAGMFQISQTAMASTQTEKDTVVSLVNSAIINGTTSLDIQKYNISKSEIMALVDKSANATLLYEDIRGGVNFSYSYLHSSKKITMVYLTFGITNQTTVNNRKKKLTSKIQEIKSEVPAKMTAPEKALYIHDYIISHSDYDYSSYSNYNKGTGYVPANDYTAYGVLVEKKGVCQGYAKAYQLLLTELGVDCVTVESPSLNHQWNMVKLGGKWYHADLTWDDPVYNDNDINRNYHVIHKYFLKNDSEMRKLGYGYWTAPYSSSSSTYSNWYFKDLEGVMGYYDGYWFATKNDCVVRAKINGSKAKTIQSGASFLRISSGRVYYVNRKKFTICSSTVKGSGKREEYSFKNRVNFTNYAMVKYSDVSSNGKVYVAILDYMKVSNTTLSPIYKAINYTIKANSANTSVAKTSITSLKSSGKKVTLVWKKVSGATGYQIYRSTKKSSGYKLVKKITNKSTVKYVQTLAKKGTYYYKIKVYKVVSGKTYKSGYCTYKSVKVK